MRREAAAGTTVGLCLVDPPYSLLTRIIGDLGPSLAPLLAPGARLVVERAARTSLPEVPDLPTAARTDRTYGDTAVTVLVMEGE